MCLPYCVRTHRTYLKTAPLESYIKFLYILWFLLCRLENTKYTSKVFLNSIVTHENGSFFWRWGVPFSIWSSRSRDQGWVQLQLWPKPQLWQYWIPNPLCYAQDQTCIPVLPINHQSPCTTEGSWKMTFL